jgi:hypothetical protein
MHFHQMDDDLITSYRQREEELSIYPYLRVFCACTKFIGKKVTADVINTLMAVDECSACNEFICMACTKPLDKEHLSASASDHGCREKIETIEKLHQDLLDGEDRGKKSRSFLTADAICSSPRPATTFLVSVGVSFATHAV